VSCSASILTLEVAAAANTPVQGRRHMLAEAEVACMHFLVEVQVVMSEVGSGRRLRRLVRVKGLSPPV
jgi:hypothetical protein